MQKKWHTPAWWYENTPMHRLIRFSLTPLSYLYGFVVLIEQKRKNTYKSPLKVICIGNYTAGGAGKTPTAILISEILTQMGEKVCFLSRGYGGCIRGPHLLNIQTDKPETVGDEPLLLARHAPVMIAADRGEGARAIESQTNATVIVMDDGFQNAGLHKDVSMIVVDGKTGLGNGQSLPAGPLRGFLRPQIARTDIFLSTRRGTKTGALEKIAQNRGIPFIQGRIKTSQTMTDWIHGKKLVAFTGIGLPEKFYATLKQAGGRLVETRSFPDHHLYTQEDAKQILAVLNNHPGAYLVTTEKDQAKITRNKELSSLAKVCTPVPISLEIETKNVLKLYLEDAFKRLQTP